MPSSKVLIVTICSNHKAGGGSKIYDHRATLMRSLPGSDKALLRERRREAAALLQNATRYNVWVPAYDYNKLLNTQTYEFGYTRGATYLPAVERYTGRFYGSEGLASDGARPLNLVTSSPHHLLIVSGLYGFVCGAEPIQRYSLHISDHPQLREVWVRSDMLTALLLSYCRVHGIQRVFDLCGCEQFRSLIRWDRAGNELPCGVIHAFSKLNAGDGCLPALGRLAQGLLQAGEDELLTKPLTYLSVGDEDLVLTTSRVPPNDWPYEPVGSPVPTDGDKVPWWPQRDRPCEVTSGNHTTFFGHHVHSLQDVPSGARDMLEMVSRMNEVTRVLFGRFRDAGSYGEYSLEVDSLGGPDGRVTGKIRGPRQKASEQDLEIRVQPGCEAMVAYRIRAIAAAVTGERSRTRRD